MLNLPPTLLTAVAKQKKKWQQNFDLRRMLSNTIWMIILSARIRTTLTVHSALFWNCRGKTFDQKVFLLRRKGCWSLKICPPYLLPLDRRTSSPPVSRTACIDYAVEGLPKSNFEIHNGLLFWQTQDFNWCLPCFSVILCATIRGVCFPLV